MKQNLIQKQLRLSHSQPYNNQLIQKTQHQSHITADFTSKAYFIANQILDNDYLFSKRALATFLHGKPIILQQKSNQPPPSTLKGYMSLYDDVTIEKMIDLMIDLNILGEKRVSLKQRSTKRLFTTKKFQFENFPKVILRVKQQKSIQLHPTVKKQKVQNQKMKQKSRLSSFLVTKTSLPVNVQKKQYQLKIKTQKQKEQEQQRKRRLQEQIRLKRQQQVKAIELEKQKQIEIKNKQQQKKNHLQKMNNFWLKQKQKIQQFISPKKLKNQTIQKQQRYLKQKQKIQQKCIQIAGNVLQMQMKELKQQQEQKKNPIKPYISWSFVKNTLGIDSSQSNNEKKQQFKAVIEVKKQKVSHKKSLKESQQNIVNIEYSTFKKDKQQNQKEQKTPYLGIHQSHKLQNDQQQHSISYNHSQSTDVTMTNYRLQKMTRKNTKDQYKKEQTDQIDKQKVFARNPKESMFSNSYYILGDKGEQTVTNKKIEKRIIKNNQISQDQKGHVFTFKRKSTLLANEETYTVAKRMIQRTFQQDQCNDVNGQEQEVKDKIFKRHKRQEKQQNDEIQQTITLAVPKKLGQKKKTREFMQVVFSQDIPSYQVEIFSQTKTTPEPKTKNKKVSTSDLYPIKSQYQEREPKRDSFVEELIKDYYNKKPRM